MQTGITPEQLTELAVKAVYLSGMTDADLAKLLDIDRETLYVWYNDRPEFKAAIVQARDRHNVEVLEKSLIKRAQGYDVTETETGNRGDQEIDIKKTKHVPPDTGALQFFLKIRSPERWKEEKQDSIGELAEVFAMIVNRTRSLPATRKPDIKDDDIVIDNMLEKRKKQISQDKQDTFDIPVDDEPMPVITMDIIDDDK